MPWVPLQLPGSRGGAAEGQGLSLALSPNNVYA